MLGLEVLILKLLAVDRLAARALKERIEISRKLEFRRDPATDIAACKVTTLGHEPGNHTVESRAGIAEALFACCESAEVGCGLGDDVVIEFELDATPVVHCLVLVSLD